jgi:hypothetical protein
MESTCFQCARARLALARARSVPLLPFSHSNIILIFPLFVSLTPLLTPPRVPSHLAHPFLSPLSVLTSSSRTQKQIHSNSRSNSVSSVSTRPTQPVTEIAFSAHFQTNSMEPSLVISSFARTYVIGFSRTVSAMHPSLTMNVAWTSTFLLCVNQVRPRLCSIINQAPTTKPPRSQPPMAVISNSLRSRI